MSGYKADSTVAKDTEEQERHRALMHLYREIPTPELHAQYKKACRESVELHDKIVGMRSVLNARQKVLDAQAKLADATDAAKHALRSNGGAQ